jgi:hypothetical protein
MAKGQRRHGAKRDPKLEAFWRGVLDRFGKCDLSVRGFCRREKLSEPSFYAWRRIIQGRGAGRPKGRRRPGPCTPFVPVLVRDEPRPVHDSAITVEWPCGRALRVPLTIASERLAELARAIESVTEGRA